MNTISLIRYLGLGIGALWLSACSTAPSETMEMANGEGRGYRITCGGTFSSASECFERAGYICGNRGYTVLKETDISPPDGSMFWAASAHEALIRCNGDVGGGGPMGMGTMNGPAGSMGSVGTH